MPLSRYQIRNEYTLADPDLYKVADKDDPEALLEGVAMAGLVGVLRQLGDLAEFAAEIFHDLHEEVMSTAARGHSLIARVQQLEAEFPLVERTLLSQTSHTAFLYNSGIDWHPNARMDENVITQKDLPRFVMDSYEECRGPPRLFLLDKFDVAGAGACLKRFTDPSFFKTEASSTGKKLDGQRERKTRRVKKRGQLRRNEEAPETVLSSHAKLHQLFLEELIETGGNDPDRRVKLKKRQFTGSLFDQVKTKGYMEKLLDASSPEQKIVHEVCIDALSLPWRSDDGCESGLEIVEIGTVSPVKESRHSSPNSRKMVVRPSLEGFSEGNFNDTNDTLAVQDVPRLNHGSDYGKVSSAIYKVRREEEFTDRESKLQVVAYDDGNSDNVASDIDNYMDALATIESEVETDSESKRTPRYLNWKPIVEDSDASDGLRDSSHGSLFYARSFGNSTTSEDSNNFFRERCSSSRSVSANTLAESMPDLVVVVAAVPPTRASNTVRATCEAPENKTKEGTVRDVDVETDEISKNVQEFGDSSNTSDLSQTEILSGVSDPRHVNGGTTSFFNGTDFYVPERAESVCSESLSNPKTTHDGLPQIESEKTYSGSSSVEELSNGFCVGDLSASSYPYVPEILKPVDGALELDLSNSLTEEISDNEEKSETSHCRTPPQEVLSSSQRYSSLTNVETEEKATCASVVAQTEISLFPISNGLQTCASESSFSGTDDAAEKGEYDSSEAAVVSVVSSGNLPNGEVLFRSSDGEMMGETTMPRMPSAVIEHDFTETGKQYLENETNVEQKLVSSTCQTDPVEAVELLNETETTVVEVYASKHDVTNNLFSDPEFPVNMGRLEHKENAEVLHLPQENCIPSSSSSLFLEKDYHKSEHELAADIQTRGNFDILESPSTSENEGMEDKVHSLSHDLSKTMVPLQKLSYFQHDESQAKPLDVNQQIQISEYDHHGQSSMPILAFQAAVPISTPPKIESTPFFPGINTLSNTNKATEMTEYLEQSTPGFPVLGMLPPEPHIDIDSPPLPPLPPMQWRMSRFQNSSANIERLTVQQHISDPVQPIVLPTSNYGTETFIHTSIGASQPLEATISDVSLENSMDFSLPSQSSSASQNGTSISEESCQPNLSEPELFAADRTSGHDSSVKETKPNENDVQIQNEQPEHISQITEQEAINSHVQFLSSSSPVHYDWQGPPGLMAPEARLHWSSAYDGIPTNEGTYANGTEQKKLPRPRNPLIYEIVACDKSKLRKVERVKPAVESKPEEGESFLEQLQLRKVERVKPPVESKAQEKELVLEHLQLKKVTERVNSHNPEIKTEERESLLEHVQLRKVKERVKSEAEQKPEGTESPRVQLRKVGEKVIPEVEERPEETESPLVQLKKVSQKVAPEVQEKPEETESPRVQLRKVGETAPLPAAPQIEDRDSILEQIRNKTFSLKPAVATRPNIQGPRTNLKVAAILEKASNIRQAMAGSDEENDDDADKWSDC